jgi:cytochrome c553
MRLPGPAAIVCLIVLISTQGAESEIDFFEKRIRPVLVENCYSCHSAESEKLKGGLLLDSREGLARGGDTGPVIIPGDPDSSPLIKAIRWNDEQLQMPPKKKLGDDAITDLEAWVKMGAPEPRSSTNHPQISRAAVDHWAFQRPGKQAIPTVQNSAWLKTEIDNFILRKLESANLQPSAPANKRTLLRRASYDLTGLPPTFEEVAAFERDSSPEAFERAIDRLLESPRYGERWARHWLDVARFADTKGYVYSDREESQFVHSYVYRDWVIKAFNDDMPYDRFLVEQIAGDQLPASEGLNSPLAAMGFLTVGRRFLGVTHDIIDDRIDTLTKATQALTVSCARCHDHKFDPIPIQDYYSLYGVFSASTERATRLDSSEPDTKDYREFKKGYDERIAKLQETFEKRKSELLAKVRLKTPEYLLAVLEADKLPTEEHYEIRGPDDLNPTIARQWQSYLFQTAKQFHPVWAPWHSFAKLSKSNFFPAAEKTWSTLQSSSDLNPAIREAFESNAPTSMQEVAAMYGRLLSEVNRKHIEKAELSPAEAQLADVLYGADSPVTVPSGSVWDVEWFFHEAVRVEFGKLQSEIDRWIIKSSGAPRFAVALVDKPNP